MLYYSNTAIEIDDYPLKSTYGMFITVLQYKNTTIQVCLEFKKVKKYEKSTL